MHASVGLSRFCRSLQEADRGDLTLEEIVATSDGGPAAKIGLLLADHEKTLQDLVSQIVTHWKACCLLIHNIRFSSLAAP